MITNLLALLLTVDPKDTRVRLAMINAGILNG